MALNSRLTGTRSEVEAFKIGSGRISTEPYHAGARNLLSKSYSALGYPDLAAGEAYMAILLVDEIWDSNGEYHEEAIIAVRDEFMQTQEHESPESFGADQPELPEHLERPFQEFVNIEYEKPSYILLAENLLLCDGFGSASEYCTRGLSKFPKDEELCNLQTRIKRAVEARLGKDIQKLSWQDYPERGLVRRELYPWNDHEPNRFSDETLNLLNGQMQKMAPKIEIRVTGLPNLREDRKEGSATKQLGVFAKEDLLPGDTILCEKSPLTATSRLNDEFCDACSTALSASSMDTSVSCPECMDTIFCSQVCMDMANEMYHPALCGADTSSIAKNAPPAEVADALYSLLLLRVFAMAETQGVHPLDLPEVKYITGDYEPQLAEKPADIGNPDGFSGRKRTLPFSFRSNVLLPIHMLEKLDVDIFKTAHRYAPWVSNTLYAKFRGTASARQGPNGLPTVAAVYPLWCLANHSCDPNAAWEWQGVKKFWVRERRVTWKGKNQPREPGVKKGDEVFSHYCDIDLPVAERREWASGALGGECLCERCLWETDESRE